MHLTVIRMWLNLRPQNLNHNYTYVYTGTACESGLVSFPDPFPKGVWERDQVRPGYNIQACCTQAGPAQAAGRGNGMDR